MVTRLETKIGSLESAEQTWDEGVCVGSSGHSFFPENGISELNLKIKKGKEGGKEELIQSEGGQEQSRDSGKRSSCEEHQAYPLGGSIEVRAALATLSSVSEVSSRLPDLKRGWAVREAFTFQPRLAA